MNLLAEKVSINGVDYVRAAEPYGSIERDATICTRDVACEYPSAVYYHDAAIARGL